MHRCEVAEQPAHVLGLAAHKHAVIGDEHLVEVDQGLVVRVGLAQVDTLDVAAHFEEALILRGAAQYEGEARSVGGDGAKSFSSGFMLVVGTMMISWANRMPVWLHL